MSDELRAAAKLLVSKNTSNRYDNAGVMLAKVYLVEHPDDDGEFVDKEWLVDIFGRDLFAERWKRYALMLCCKSDLIVSWCPACDDLAPCLCIGTSVIKENPTRGDVRRLCKALGIELKEKS
jgi:hypothetical protein